MTSAATNYKRGPRDIVVTCTDRVTYVIRTGGQGTTFTCPGCGKVGHA